MWLSPRLLLAAMLPLHGVDIADLKRSEDWEVQLAKASALAREQKFDEASSLFEILVSAAEEHQFPLPLKAKCLNNHGAMLHLHGNYSAAEDKYRQAAEYWKRSTGEFTDERATTLNNLGEVHRLMGRYPEAESAYRESLAIREAVIRDQRLKISIVLNNLGTSQSAPLPISVVNTISNLGEVQRMQRRLLEAKSNFERALALKREILGEEHPDLATAMNNLAAVRQDLGELDEAEKLYLGSIGIREKSANPDRPALASAINNLGTLYRRMGRSEDAAKHIERAVAMWRESLGAEHPSVASGLNNLAEVYMTVGRTTDAEPLFRESLAIYEKKLGAGHVQTATAVDNLGVLFLRQQKPAGAETLFRRALRLRSERLGGGHPQTIETLHHLGQSLQAQKKFTEAERTFVDELTRIDSAKMQRSVLHGQALAELVYLSLAQRRLDAGERYLREVNEIADGLPQSQRSEIAQLYEAYAQILRQTKRSKEAGWAEGKAKSLLP